MCSIKCIANHSQACDLANAHLLLTVWIGVAADPVVQ